MGDITDKAYGFDESSELAKTNGYAINPTQQVIQEKTKVFVYSNSPASASYTEVTIVTEKYYIFSIDAIEKERTQKIEPLVADFKLSTVFWGIVGTKIIDNRYREFSTWKKPDNNAGLNKSSYEAGTRVQYYKSWDDYSTRTKGKGELLKHRK